MSSAGKLADQFKDIAFILMPVKDMPKSREFYEGVLGLEVTAQWDNEWVEYNIGSGTVALTKAAEVMQAGNQGGRLAIEVRDMDAVLKMLDENEVETVRKPWDTETCRGCFITDPDGNEIMLHLVKK